MKEKILIINEEIVKGIPSGVISLTNILAKELIKNFNVKIVVNNQHWLNNNNTSYKASKKNFHRLKLKNFEEINYLLKKKKYSLIPRILFFIMSFFINLACFYEIFFLIKKEKPNLILNQIGGWPLGNLNYLVIICSYFLRIKNISIIHNYPRCKNLFDTKSFVVSYLCDRIFTVSRNCKKILLEKTYLKNIDFIHNSCEDFSKKKKINFKKEKKFILGFVGHIHKRKGLEILLSSIRNTSKNIKLYLVGGGQKTYINKILIIGKKLNIDLEYLGLFRKKINFYCNFDTLILPSTNMESFGLVLIEAMSAGIPVICSDTGGMKEIVKDNYNGLVFKNKDHNNLRKKIFYLMRNKNLQKKFIKNGKKIFIKKFTSEIMVNKYLRQIQKLLT